MKSFVKKFAIRIQNPKVITAVISGVLLVLANNGIIDAKVSGSINDAFGVILTLLVALGVFGNPESHVQAQPTETVEEKQA